MPRPLLLIASWALASAVRASCPPAPAYERVASLATGSDRLRVDLRFTKKLTLDTMEAAACHEIERILAEADVTVVDLRVWGPGAVAGSNPTATAVWAPYGDPDAVPPPGGRDYPMLRVHMPGRPPTVLMLEVTRPVPPTPTPTPIPTPTATPPPPPTPPPAPPPPLVDEATRRNADILATVERWREAWEAREIDRYMSFYAPDFRSDGKDWKQWRARKAAVFKGLSQLKLEVQDAKVQVVGKRAMVVFTQVYTTDKRADIGEKTLYIELRDGVYQIVRETFRRPGEKRHE